MEQAPVSTGRASGASVCARAAGIPLFHAAWLFAAGIAVAAFFWIRPGTLFVSLALLSLACIAAALRAQRLIPVPMAFLWILLGAWCAQMEPHPSPAGQLLSASDGLLRTIEGSVTSAGPVRGEVELNVDAPAEELPSQRLDVKLASIESVDESADRQVPIDGTVRLTIRWDKGERPVAIPCGARIRAVARLLPPQTYHDPGAWNRTGYLLDQDVTSTATVPSARVEQMDAPVRSSFACMLSSAQHAAAARILALPITMSRLPEPMRIRQDDAIMLAAMVTGDRTFLSHSLRREFERTGSFHMLVVSGLHLAIVAGCIAWLLRLLRVPRVPATLLIIGGSLAYALFTGFATPVQRSWWMVTLYLIARLLYRERTPLNAIGFAALCLLVASPRSLLDSGFQMTLLAVVSIAGIAVPLLASAVHPYATATRDLRLVGIDAKLPPRVAQFRVLLRMFAARLRAVSTRWVGWIAFPWIVRFVLQSVEALTVTLVVEMAMTLPMAIYFHRLTLFALPVNLLILPLLVILMPAALITLLALLVSPAVAVIPGAATAMLLHIGVSLVRLFGSAAWSDLRMPLPTKLQIAAFCLLLGAAIVLARSQGVWRRRAAWGVLAGAAFAVVLPRPVQHPRDAMLVEALDVGQGDSLLLITPDGKTLLVDGGGFGGGPRQGAPDFDIGEEVVSAALWARGIRHLDAVALSHAHSDHMGGLPAVLRNFHPDELWVGNNPPVPAYNALLDQAARLHTRVRTLRAGNSLSFGNAAVRVFAPMPGYMPGKDPANNDSLVLRVAYGGTSVLLEGDAEQPIEQDMLGENGLASTLLKVGHHGSVSSTRPEFLSRVSPQWAVISCGLHNHYGHPRAEVLEQLEASHVHTLSTDINGAVCLRLDGSSIAQLASCVQ